jgi:5'-nucleotidase (lipoprotein e(P4) family)
MIRITACTLIFCTFLALVSAEPTANTYENLNAVLWVQTSVEYQASVMQTYHLAESSLLRGLQDQHWTAALEQDGNFEALPPAVILDLDETVLDNSGLEARFVATGEHYSDQTWTKWVNEQRAGLVPGAMHFLQFAHSHGVAPIYITNRTCDVSNTDDPTIRVLRRLQVPLNPVQDRLLCAQDKDDTDKTTRRARCATKYRILLLFGDQLGDFLHIPKELSDIEGRQKLFAAHEALWGERWFQLPNPMYGSWEGAVGYALKEKLSKLRN